MKNLPFLLLLILYSIRMTAQNIKAEDPRSISAFEKNILSKKEPLGQEVEFNFGVDMRFIIWTDALIKKHKYSIEVLDKLGYEYMKTTGGDGRQRTKIYRNCRKGITLEVTEWFGDRMVVSMNWYTPEVRQNIGYLMFCE